MFAVRGEDSESYYAHIDSVIDAGPNLTMDDGCDLVSRLHQSRQDKVGDVLAGVRLQQKYEQRAFELGRGEYACPVQRATDYLRAAGLTPAGRLPPTSYPRGVVSADLREVLPPVVADAVAHGLPQMDRRWHGRFLADALLAGPEARGSSPVRIDRDAGTRESPGVPGLYPVG